MASMHPCVYCLEVPRLDRGRRGRIERCPLCKTELLKAGNQSYRLCDDEGEPLSVLPPPSRWPGVVGVAVALLFAAGMGLAYFRQSAAIALPHVPEPIPVSWEDETLDAQAEIAPEPLPFPRVVAQVPAAVPR